MKIKNIEISLCYTFITQSKIYINWIFYHFMIYTNNYNITFSFTRKWKFFSRFITSRSFSILINKKLNRSNVVATSSFTYQFFTIILFMKSKLIFNKKYVESKIMCQSIKIEINSFKNINVAFFKFFRKCRHCKQFFIFENLFYKHISYCNINIKKFKHARITKKLNDFWKKLSN